MEDRKIQKEINRWVREEREKELNIKVEFKRIRIEGRWKKQEEIGKELNNERMGTESGEEEHDKDNDKNNDKNSNTEREQSFERVKK